MSQVCGKIPTTEDLGYIAQTMVSYLDRYGNILVGNAGEEVAVDYAVTQMGVREEPFDKAVHGFDCVFRDGSGKLVIGEAKATKASGVSSLSMTVHGKEGSVEWVRYKAELMCDPCSSLYSERNRAIGEEILRVGPENVRFVVIHINPETLAIDTTDLRGG